jgi:hypothetical protein
MQWQRRILAFALALPCSAFVEAQQPQASVAPPNDQTVLTADTSTVTA